MAKFKSSRAAEGTRSRWPIKFPGRTNEDGSPLIVDVRVLNPTEYATALDKAAKFTKRHGFEPRVGEELYELGKMAYVVAVAVTDPDSPKDKPERYFEREEVLFEDPEITDRLIAYLYEHWEIIQSESGGYDTKLPLRELIEAVKTESAATDPSFFLRLSPRMRWAFTHTMASLLATSQGDSLLSTLLSSSEPTSSTSSSEQPPIEPEPEQPSEQHSPTPADDGAA